MSIATRTGDQGETSLMYGRRVPKTHPRVEAYGTVDELNACLGLARASAHDPWSAAQVLQIQKDLVSLMGQLAVDDADAERYASSSHPKFAPSMLEQLDSLVLELEGRSIRFEGWATPGATPAAAAFDLARTVCRRAERSILLLKEQGSATLPPLALPYFNRLADVLWLLARWEETPPKSAN